MRLIIDLQACQHGSAADRATVLALAAALVRNAGQHEVLIALSLRHPDSVDALRLAFADLLPASHLRSYRTPPAGTVWQRRAAEQMRAAFFDSLQADVVLAPGLFDQPHPDLILPVAMRALNVLTLASAAALRLPPASAQHAVFHQQQQALRQADLVLTAAVDQQRLLSEALKPLPVLAIGAVDDSAAGALWDALAAALTHRPASAVAAPRPRLAMVTPLPPEQSGIADYSAELAVALEPYYQIELVSDQAAPPPAALSARFPWRSGAYFEQHADQYDRVLYHFGNSNVHQAMFALLQRQPGIVVLHDFFLSGVLDNMERDGVAPQAFLQALYAAHGYGGLLEHGRGGRNPSIWAFPCNKTVLDQASGVIVHSDFSCRLAEQWYGPDSAAHWRTVPLLRGLPPAASGQAPDAARQAARAALGLGDDEFIICSFGMLGPTKLNERLLAAFLATPLAHDVRCRLVYVGQNEGGRYGHDLLRQIAASPAAGRICITGFASADAYTQYLQACDIAVQLRSQTRGETSASVLDCLLHGVPTIINAHGAAADLPEAVLCKLPDQFDDGALGQALEALYRDPARRGELGQRGRQYVAERHAPQQVGHLYRQAIEHFASHGPRHGYQRLLTALAHIDAAAPTEPQLIECAAMIAANAPPGAPRQMLVDISALVQADHKTGIQRVVRSIVLALIKAPPAGYRIEPVYSEGGKRRYRYARQFMSTMLGVAAPQLEDAPADCRPGDLFLGLDLFTNGTSQNESLLLDMRRQGVAIHFVVYDLLPLQRPQAFPFGAEKYYSDYIDSIACVADGVVCISRAVADELAAWLATRPNRRLAPLQLGYFHLGADIDASAPSAGLPDNAERVLQAVCAAPSLLMVGTLEPRKGQAQALAAFELLWQRGVAVNLVIVGKQGWLVESLVKCLEQHPQRNIRLFWLPGVADDMLRALYEACAALLAASEAEGFGLPLIEAAQHDLPIVARDLPVFREVAGDHAYYFDGLTPEALADALQAWLALHQAGQAPRSDRLPWLTWQESALQLMDVVLGGRWYRELGTQALAPRLLVDVSAIARHDLQTGIERVVRAQLSELLRTPNARYQVQPVYLSDEGGSWHYRHARRYSHRLLGTSDAGVSDDPISVAAGDIYYCPDFYPAGVIAAARAGLYARWRQAGVQLTFLVHDLLPVLQPQHFPAQTDAVHAQWLDCIASHADRLLCISAAVADETRSWLHQHAPQRPLPAIAVLHHGADLAASQPSSGLPPEAATVLADLASVPSFLMVGTIEPRKGHLQALEAFEQLWARGSDVRLVIVGREGWTGLPAGQRRTIPAIVARLRQHPEAGRRLHWLDGISDEYLEQVYRACACLLVPSEGEGFGLPLIEAARQQLPLIARDLPVFREVAQQHAYYFSGAGSELCAAVQDWLRLHAAGQAPASAAIPWLSWTDNVGGLIHILFSPPTPDGVSA